MVHRTADGRQQVLLVHRRHPRLWALPKGTPDSGETIEETALRETREETGLKVEIERPLRSIRYYFVRGSTRFHKTVHFFLMQPVGGALEEHDAEFDEVRWTDVEEAGIVLAAVVEPDATVSEAEATA